MQYNKRDVCINDEFEYIFIKDFNDGKRVNKSDEYDMNCVIKNIINDSLLLRLHYLLCHFNIGNTVENHNYFYTTHGYNYMVFEFVNIMGFSMYISIRNRNKINKDLIIFDFDLTNTHFTSSDDTINLFKSILMKNNLIDKLINLKLNNFIYNII